MMGFDTAQSVRVWCRAESRYAERPTAFVWQGRRIAVQHILAQWREPSGPVFRVVGNDDRVYVLQYDEALDVWQMVQ
ncbi:MAG: hypothetical protein GXO56_02520 [Chloroflexi bacterium]|nr:hypothetical protein [Chloroflexota bacterium]